MNRLSYDQRQNLRSAIVFFSFFRYSSTLK
nr:MAG TPA: hypothetical protein [Caudoviricetes sp.]